MIKILLIKMNLLFSIPYVSGFKVPIPFTIIGRGVLNSVAIYAKRVSYWPVQDAFCGIERKKEGLNGLWVMNFDF